MFRKKPVVLENLVQGLSSEDGMVRLKSRKSLVDMGKPAVHVLSDRMQHSDSVQLRWEAAKALSGIGDQDAITPFIKMLEDSDPDVAWVAADSLGKFKMSAWPPLLERLTKDKAESYLLRQGAHHVFRDQKEEGYDDLLAKLRKGLESAADRVSATAAAHDILHRMRTMAGSAPPGTPVPSGA